MYLFRLIIVIALLNFDLSSNTKLVPSEISTEVAVFDPCLLGSWRVDMPSMSRAFDRPVSGSILITFETTPVNEITASFDVTMERRPPDGPIKRRVHQGSLSATHGTVESDRAGAGRFKLTFVELGEENSHVRYTKHNVEKALSKDEIKAVFYRMSFYYKDCSPTMMYGLNEIKLNKEPY